jgi:hypothetical protein
MESLTVHDVFMVDLDAPARASAAAAVAAAAHRILSDAFPSQRA